MTFDLWSFILENLEAAGVIGGYVSISIIGVSLITYATKGKLTGQTQIGPEWSHPIIGALLGAIPGCGATIVVSAMYKNQKISFGGLFATFIATLGEGSFVLLGASDEARVAANLTAFIIVNVIGIIVAIIFGYVIDAFGIRFSSNNIPEPRLEERQHTKKVTKVAHTFIEQYGLYFIIAMAIFLLPSSVAALWGGEIAGYDDLTVWVTTLLTLVAIIYFFVYKFSYKGYSCSCNNDIKSTMLHAVSDISTVIVYVFIGLFVANYIIDVVVGVETFDMWMTSSALIVVIIAAFIGATPGCGGMISVAVAFTTIDNFPIAALVAAAIATSGDGIFPLLAANKKDALIITTLSLVIALIVGYTLLTLGFKI
ncbi:membrane protein [Halolactibacillus alkaliphilus]|uniref:Membrane protein n=1 Tax=Halolactibacillus alkaliphilus TaxID=442899 RepID=A0A511X3Q1_9BACI|nr:putative manganese transporter [Halolactibacillus alkaliphilus]GEN57571.1 membrane protein [Halolactibacillus alkaliphilus]GGN74270.1 membrane protein [Halolactibacillus alkaliphilus]SFP00451.1 Putative, 10TM heavy-metal exporter [Halolactibacillus alkaliphilus]